MTTIPTPWGDAGNLGERALNPGPGTPREEVQRDRRERLFAAMVANVTERGYDATSVANLTELAHISRTAFYGLFASKQDCFVATIDEIAKISGAAARQAADGEDSWEGKLRAMLETVVGFVAAQPATAALLYKDAYTAGPAAVDSAERSLAVFEELSRQALAESPKHAGLPPEILHAALGGLHLVVETHLRTGRQDELLEQVPVLLRWALSYETPDPPLRRPRLPAGPLGSPRRIEHDPEERIMNAVLDTVAAKGYVATTVADIAGAASMSLTTFYGHFSSKEDVFMAALERGRAQAMAAVLPPFQRAPDWEHSVRAGIKALLTFLAVETSWARVAVQVRSAGSRSTDHGGETIELFGHLLSPGQSASGEMPPVTRAAVGGAIFALLSAEVRAGRVERLPELAPIATFVALAPFVGTAEASRIANITP